MNLFKDTGVVVSWTFKVLRRFSCVTRRTTWATIASLTVARITRMLAFLLPLKVILLAGSDGVPRHFRFFISTDHRDQWIIGLAVAAVCSYVVTLLLEAHSKRLSEKGSVDLLTHSGVMAVIANQRSQARDYYVNFMKIASAALFAAVALAALSFLNPILAVFIGGLLTFLYLLTAWALHGVTPLSRTKLSEFITLRFGNYIGVLSAVSFLACFLIILYPIVANGKDKILIALISFVLSRQLLGAFSRLVRGTVSLAIERPLIDALVFAEHRLELSETKDHRTLRELFGPRDREQLIVSKLSGWPGQGLNFKVQWRDVSIRGAAEFSIMVEESEGPPLHFRQRVFPPRLRHMVENEDLLFSHIERETLRAPPLARRFFHGEYECLVWEAGTGRAPGKKQLRSMENDFLANLWAFEPPAALVKIYASSHSFLHERLTDGFVARLDIGVDSDAEAAAMETFRDALPAVRRSLADMPLRLVNPGFRRENVVTRQEGEFHVLGWGQWLLEPIGGGVRLRLPPAEERLAAILALARARNPAAIPDFLGTQHLLLARRCSLLELAILRGTMKAGLALARLVTADRAWQQTSMATNP